MQRTIHAKTESGLDGFLRVVTTLRRKTFDVQDVGFVSEPDGASVTIVLNEHPERSAHMAVGYLKQLYQVKDIQVM